MTMELQQPLACSRSRGAAFPACRAACGQYRVSLACSRRGSATSRQMPPGRRPPPAPKRAHEEGQGSKGEQRDPKKQLTSVPLPTSAGNVANAHIAALFEQLG